MSKARMDNLHKMISACNSSDDCDKVANLVDVAYKSKKLNLVELLSLSVTLYLKKEEVTRNATTP